jgi:hypothetical protein
VLPAFNIYGSWFLRPIEGDLGKDILLVERVLVVQISRFEDNDYERS